MNIEAYILCWNEEKIIRHTLNHYQKFCSSITVIDNESTDATRDIIKKGYPSVNIISYKSNNLLCDDKHLEYKNNCWKGSNADWVIVCDCDELLWHPQLLSMLHAFKMSGFTFPTIEGYNMFSRNFPDNYHSPIVDQVTDGVRAYHFDKQIIFDPKTVAEINYSPGAHKFAPVYNMRTNPIMPEKPLFLLHYKYLGEDYLINKHLSYSTRMSDFNLKNGYGAEYLKGSEHVKTCFDLIEKSGKLHKVINN